MTLVSRRHAGFVQGEPWITRIGKAFRVPMSAWPIKGSKATLQSVDVDVDVGLSTAETYKVFLLTTPSLNIQHLHKQ
jgi:hypothetical protein